MFSRIKYKFEEICSLCPALAKTIDEPPNWLRQIVGIPTRKGKHGDNWVPRELEELVERILVERMGVGEELLFPDVMEILGDVIRDYNDVVDSLNLQIKEANTEVLMEYEKADGAMGQLFLQHPHECICWW